MTVSTRPRPVVLCILDGWGLRDEPENNAVALARVPNWNRLLKTKPWSHIGTSGRDVGLPAGQMGNSEVGHMNIGAGRVAVPDLPRIDTAIEDGSFFANERLQAALRAVKATGGTLHLLGLLSPGGVHSHQDHMAAVAKAASDAGVPVAVHAFLDGRDTPPSSAGEYLADFQTSIAGLNNVRLATITGRFFAMDRDKRWDRVEKAYLALVDARGEQAADAAAVLAAARARGETDEFVLPTVLAGFTGMKDGDALLMANFRADRAREMLTALLDPTFDGFRRPRLVDFSAAAGMAEYSGALNPFITTMFPPAKYPHTLGEVVASAGLRQLRIAETEKYAHVTFFLNGGEEAVYEGEDRIMIPSPKVATYDLKPEMSAPELTDRLVGAIEAGTYDLVVVNYANPDMVGHSGILAAAIKAAEAVDACIGRVEAAVDKAGGVLLITADHGNLEEMYDPEHHSPHTQHTTNPVAAILTGKGAAGFGIADGRLCDLAPTLLRFLGIPQPKEMTGTALLVPADRAKETRSARVA